MIVPRTTTLLCVIEHHCVCPRINHDDHVLLLVAQSFHSYQRNHRSMPCPPRDLPTTDYPPWMRPMDSNNTMRLETQCRSRKGLGESLPCWQSILATTTSKERRRARFQFLLLYEGGAFAPYVLYAYGDGSCWTATSNDTSLKAKPIRNVLTNVTT